MTRATLGFTGLLVLIAGGLSAQAPTLKSTSKSTSGITGVPAPDKGGATEVLQVGDYVPEFGIGCANGAGTAGGPNDMALGVTATSMPAEFFLESVSYNLWNNISPNITNLQFAIWSGGGYAPGATGSMTSVPFTGSGFFTVSLTPRLPVAAGEAPGGAFFIGLNQNQRNVGFSVGVDSSSGSAGTSFIRAPTCGASAFVTLDALGFPGNWVIRAVANEVQIPVELMTEVLQVGDYVPEFGIGCANGAGTAGGPNDMALGVTATSMPAEFFLESVSYNLWNNISPNITNLQFAIWSGGGYAPGATGSMTSVPFTGSGFFTVSLTPRLPVAAGEAPGGAFFIGLNQNQRNVGFSVGVDSSSGSAGTSFIRAPTCGASAFVTLDALGFPGNWVIRAVANEVLVPVELMTISFDDE